MVNVQTSCPLKINDSEYLHLKYKSSDLKWSTLQQENIGYFIVVESQQKNTDSFIVVDFAMY